MRLFLIEPPEDLPVTLAEAKAHMHVDFDDDDAQIAAMLKAAVSRLDGVDGLLGRCLCPQTWCLQLPRFKSEVAIPLPPLRAVDAITYIDPDGGMQTVPPEAYQVAGLGGEGCLLPAQGETWPATRMMPEAVSITFTAGYPQSEDSPARPLVPEPLCAAIKNHVAFLYQNREGLVASDLRRLPWGYDDLIADYRMPSF